MGQAPMVQVDTFKFPLLRKRPYFVILSPKSLSGVSEHSWQSLTRNYIPPSPPTTYRRHICSLRSNRHRKPDNRA